MDSPPKAKLLNRSRYVPMYLQGLANKLSRGASKIYLELFNVGITEWRILDVLAHEDNITANEVCDIIDLDKAAASRALKVLEKYEYITSRKGEEDSRKRHIQLTPSGINLHDEIIEIALLRQKKLLQGFSSEEVIQLLDMMQRMMTNITSSESYDYVGLYKKHKQRQKPDKS